ncbi:MAG: hypothetical protein WKF30_06465 [Pyrinomonadaceae bacterium]
MKTNKFEFTAWRRFQHRRQKGATESYSDHKHQTGEKVIAIADNHGYVLSPLTIAPVNKSDIVLLAEGLKDLKNVVKDAGLKITGTTINLDAGFDSKANRKHVFNAGMKPNIAENTQSPKTEAWSQAFLRCSLRCALYHRTRICGRTNSNACSYVLRPSVISDSNSWPSL